MKFQKIQNCFAEFFLIFSLIFSVIPAQLHYENLDLYFYLNPIFYLKILFIVIFLTILFTLIFYKYYSFITSILKISILGLILTGLLLPVGGQVDIMLKESYDLNPYFVNIFKFVFVLIFFIKVKQLAKFFIAIRYFVIFYFISIIFLLNIHIKHNYQNDDFEKLLEFSSVENLLILDFDGISNHTLLNELLLDEDTGGDLFKDFTYYSNAHSNATGTWISTNLEFFGNLPFAENIQNQKKHLLSIRENSKMINDKENYRVDVYGQYIRNFNGNVNRFYNSALNSDIFLKFYFYHFQEILLPSFNRYLSPHGVKLINSLIPNKKLNDLYQANNLNSLNFETYYDTYMQATTSSGPDRNFNACFQGIASNNENVVACGGTTIGNGVTTVSPIQPDINDWYNPLTFLVCYNTASDSSIDSLKWFKAVALYTEFVNNAPNVGPGVWQFIEMDNDYIYVATQNQENGLGGQFTYNAPNNNPGTILSQMPNKIMPSNA